MSKTVYLALILCLPLCTALCGCHPNNTGVHMPESHPLGPPYPRKKDVPLDTALVTRAQQVIREALKSDDEIQRAHAVESLKDVPLSDRDSILHAALADQSVLVRKAAALNCGLLKVQQALPVLKRMLNAIAQMGEDSTPTEQLRVAVLYALYQLGDSSHTHDLEQTFADPRTAVRCDTALVLGMMKNKSALPMLHRMLKTDPDPNARIQAAEALWNLGSEEGEDALVQATVSSYASDQAIALLALAEPRDARQHDQIVQFLSADYPEVSLVAARALGMLGADDGYGVAMAGADSKDPRQRLLAALAFGFIARTDAQPYLARLLGDSDADVRIAAADGIAVMAACNPAPPR